ncbi:MAG: response regulator [Planctomycetes bacterium]|nr:response regulator [Planctomycetota bacterium]
MSPREAGGRALLVSPSFVLRNSYAAALEDDGRAVAEAASADEVLWCLVAARMGDASPVDVIVADLDTPGVQPLLAEVRASPRSPGLVLVVGAAPRSLDPRLAGVEVVHDPRDVEGLRGAVGRARARVERRRAPTALSAPASTTAVVATEGDLRRAAIVAELEVRGATVVGVGDGLELLEALGATVRHGAPDVLVADGRLPRLDGLDALAELRELAPRTPAVIVCPEDDAAARARAAALGAVVVDRRASPALLAVRALSLARPASRRLYGPSSSSRR